MTPNPFIPIIPLLPKEKMIMEDGGVHPNWQAYFSKLNSALQTFISNSGFRLPKQSAENISNLDPTDPNTFGVTLYDTDNHLAKININGTFKTITTS